MRISDWSSDVCSSDLGAVGGDAVVVDHEAQQPGHDQLVEQAAGEKRADADADQSGGPEGHQQRQQQRRDQRQRSEEHTSELQSLMRISYAVFCLKKKKDIRQQEVTLNPLHQIKETY